MAKPSESRPVVTPRPLRTRSRATVTIAGQIGSAETSALCERARGMVAEGEADLVVCDVGGLGDCNLAAVNALARLTLLARGLGCQVQVLNASRQLRELLAFVGLAEAVPCVAPSGLEPRR